MVSEVAPLSARKARTRERFLAAATELLLRQGRSALSVSAVSRQLGVNHSLFYQHFKDMDDCLAAAATIVLDELVPIDRDHRRALLRDVKVDRRALQAHLRESLDRWLERKPFVEMLLSHRLESSPMGNAFAGALEQLRDNFTEDLWELARALSLPRTTQAMARMTADVHLNHWLWSLEVAVTGRVEDRASIAATHGDLAIATTHAFIANGLAPSYTEQVALSFSGERRRELRGAVQVLRELAEQHTDRELIDLLGHGTLDGMIDFMLRAMCPFFMPGAMSFPALIRYRVTCEGESGVGYLVLQRDGCKALTVDPGVPPLLTFEVSLRTWIHYVVGARDLEDCFGSDDVNVEGDLRMAASFFDWFYRPALGVE